MRLGNEFQDKAFPPWFPAGRIVAGVRGGVHLVGAGLAAIFLVMLAAQTVSAQNPANREYLIKAAYLYNLGRYVQWPKASLADANSPFVIGVLEPDPFGESLNVIARTKDLDGRRIEIRRFSRADEINGCHILYLPKAVAEQEAILQRLSGKHILSVGETAEFLPQGGVVHFALVENKVRLEVSLQAAKRESLQFSSKLLQLAQIVN